MRVTRLGSSLLAASLFVLGACADGTGIGAAHPVSFSIRSAADAAVGAPAALGSLAALAAVNDTLTITKVQLVIEKTELLSTSTVCPGAGPTGSGRRADDTAGHATAEAETEAESADCGELRLPASLVTLPLDGSVVSVFSAGVPAGTYDRLEVKIRPLTANRGNPARSAAFLSQHPEFDGVSARVEGIYKGVAFVYTGAVTFGFERTFDPPVTVDSTGVNLTLNVDVSQWFRSSTGAFIDPATAKSGGANAQVVANNIMRSLKAFRDDDHDGADDRGRHGGK